MGGYCIPFQTKNKHRTSQILSAFHHHFPVFFQQSHQPKVPLSKLVTQWMPTVFTTCGRVSRNLLGDFGREWCNKWTCWNAPLHDKVHFTWNISSVVSVYICTCYMFFIVWKKMETEHVISSACKNLSSYIHVPTHRTSHPLTHLWIKDKLWTRRLYSIFTNHRTKRLRCVLAKLRFWLGIHIVHVVYGRDNILPLRIIGQM